MSTNNSTGVRRRTLDGDRITEVLQENEQNLIQSFKPFNAESPAGGLVSTGNSIGTQPAGNGFIDVITSGFNGAIGYFQEQATIATEQIDIFRDNLNSAFSSNVKLIADGANDILDFISGGDLTGQILKLVGDDTLDVTINNADGASATSNILFPGTTDDFVLKAREIIEFLFDPNLSINGNEGCWCYSLGDSTSGGGSISFPILYPQDDFGDQGAVTLNVDISGNTGQNKAVRMTGDVGFNFTSPPASTVLEEIWFTFEQDGTGGHSIGPTTPTGLKNPTLLDTLLDKTANAKTTFHFITEDGGTTFRAELIDLVVSSGSQTPWLSNINAAGFSLNNLLSLDVEDSAGATKLGISGPLGVGARFQFISGDDVLFTENITDRLKINADGLDVFAGDILQVDRLQMSGGTTSATSVNDVVWYLDAAGDLVSNINASDGWIWSSGNITKMVLTDTTLEKRSTTAPSFQLYNTIAAANGTAGTISILANSQNTGTGVTMGFIIGDTEVFTGDARGALKFGVNLDGTPTLFLTMNEGNDEQVDILQETDFNSQDVLAVNRLQMSGGTASATSVNDVVWYLDSDGNLISNVNATDGWIWSSGNIAKMVLTDSTLEKRNVTAPVFQLYNTIAAQVGTAATINFLANSTSVPTGISMGFLIGDTEAIAGSGRGALKFGVNLDGTPTLFLTMNEGNDEQVDILKTLDMNTNFIQFSEITEPVDGLVGNLQGNLFLDDTTDPPILMIKKKNSVGGVSVVSLEAGGGAAGSLSGLTIDVTKDWQAFGITNLAFISSTSADVADTGFVRMGNGEFLAWEASPTGTDGLITYNSLERFQFNGPLVGDTNLAQSLGNSGVRWNTIWAQTVELQSGSGALLGATIGSTNTLNGTLISTNDLSYADGLKQTFNPNGTNAGINVGVVATTDPSSLANGDLWYNTGDTALKARINGATIDLGAGASGADTALSNLTNPTDINQDLLPDSAGVRNLGSDTLRWGNCYFGRIVWPTSTSPIAAEVNIVNQNDDMKFNVSTGNTFIWVFQGGSTQLELSSTELILDGVNLDMENNNITDANQIQITGSSGDTVRGFFSASSGFLNILEDENSGIIRMFAKTAGGVSNNMVNIDGGTGLVSFEQGGIGFGVSANRPTIIRSGNDLQISTVTASSIILQSGATDRVNLTGTDLNILTGTFVDWQESVSSATSGASTLPGNPAGFIKVKISGTERRIPFYAV